MQSIQLADFDRDALRTRLRKMSDEELREFGKAARYMVSPNANMGKPPLPTFVLQLQEARASSARGIHQRCFLIPRLSVPVHKFPVSRLIGTWLLGVVSRAHLASISITASALLRLSFLMLAPLMLPPSRQPLWTP